MYTTLFWIIISLIVITTALDAYLDHKNRSYASQPIPEELTGIYDDEKYKKQQSYFIDKNKLSSIASIFSFVIMMLMLFFFGFGFVDKLARSIVAPAGTWDTIATGLLFFGIIYIANEVISIPFAYKDIFSIEQKYGFNNSTIKLFVTDTLKEWLLTAILGGLLMGLLMLIYHYTEEYFWILGWGVMVAFSILTMMFYSSVIVPLFNKQTPLPDGELRTAIEDFCKKVDFKLSNLYVMDSSKRTTKANAYFSGLGSKKRIVLYDTLISTLSTDEIVAVLSHEIGHYKHKHTRKMLIFNILYFGLMFFIMSLMLKYGDYLCQTLGGYCNENGHEGSFWLSLIAFTLVFSPISTITGILTNIVSRHNEYEADHFAKEHGKADLLISALKKLSSESLTNLTPHPYYIFVNYSHPTLLQRIKALKR